MKFEEFRTGNTTTKTGYQPELENKKVELWYKRTARSGWRKSSIMMLCYTQYAFLQGNALLVQNEWDQVEWREYSENYWA